MLIKRAKKSDLAKLKSNVDNLDIEKLKHVPIDFKKLSNVVDKYGLKKSKYKSNKHKR